MYMINMCVGVSKDSARGIPQAYVDKREAFIQTEASMRLGSNLVCDYMYPFLSMFLLLLLVLK